MAVEEGTMVIGLKVLGVATATLGGTAVGLGLEAVDGDFGALEDGDNLAEEERGCSVAVVVMDWVTVGVVSTLVILFLGFGFTLATIFVFFVLPSRVNAGRLADTDWLLLTMETDSSKLLLIELSSISSLFRLLNWLLL